MITSKKIAQIANVAFVQEFLKKNEMRAKLCMKNDQYSLLLHRHGLIIEIKDVLRENYLEVSLIDITSSLMIWGGSALGICLDLNLLDIEVLQLQKFEDHPELDLFTSHAAIKMDNLHTHLQAFDKLLPIITLQGLAAIRDGTIQSKRSFFNSVILMKLTDRDGYVRCLNNQDIEQLK